MTSREAEIQARLDAATPGPWRVEAPWQDDTSWIAFLDTEGERGYSGYVVTTESKDTGEEYTEADAALIANSPADLAYLLARVATLEAQVAAVREVHVEMPTSASQEAWRNAPSAHRSGPARPSKPSTRREASHEVE